jgi:hypothetical protein
MRHRSRSCDRETHAAAGATPSSSHARRWMPRRLEAFSVIPEIPSERYPVEDGSLATTLQSRSHPGSPASRKAGSASPNVLRRNQSMVKPGNAVEIRTGGTRGWRRRVRQRGAHPNSAHRRRLATGTMNTQQDPLRGYPKVGVHRARMRARREADAVVCAEGPARNRIGSLPRRKPRRQESECRAKGIRRSWRAESQIDATSRRRQARCLHHRIGRSGVVRHRPL